jgi:UrcA family protein
MKTKILNESAARGKITWLMVLCGTVGAVVAGASVAATPSDAAPSIAVHYSAEQLATDDGARALYHTLVKAAEQVCPDMQLDPHMVSSEALLCRRQALARAVQQIHNERLAQVYSSRTKRG